jgi:PAS domain S-box-containing protein
MQTRFIYRILLPSLFAVFLFLASMFVYVIPDYRESLMDKKRETIRELTNTAWSVLNKLNGMVSDSLQIAEAQHEASLIISEMRYGSEMKDYFWITDTMPRMVMHPYRPQLNGMDLSEYEDMAGKKFFVEIVHLVDSTGDGFINYKWQWKDDSLMVVPKLSYVKAYEPWGWIVGTGIYVEDVKREIAQVTRQVVYSSIVITLLIAALIAYLARRNYTAELLRIRAQNQLKETLEKYKMLVEASPDGVLMTMENKVVYYNTWLTDMLGFGKESLDDSGQNPEQLLALVQMGLEESVSESGMKQLEVIAETSIRRKDGMLKEVIIHRSVFETSGKQGFIYTVKDVSKHMATQRELDVSLEKFRSIAGWMNLGVFRCTVERIPRIIEMNTTGVELLGFSSIDQIREIELLKLFHDNEEKRKVLKAIAADQQLQDMLVRVKIPDGGQRSLLLSLFPVMDHLGKLQFFDGILVDAYEHLSRRTGYDHAFSGNQLTPTLLLKPLLEFVSYPPVCVLDTPVETACRLMVMKQSDLVVVTDSKGSLLGVVTHGDISRRYVYPDKKRPVVISEIMSSPIVSISDQEMVVDAFSLMVSKQVSYVVVISGEGKPPAYVSLAGLTELRADTPEFLMNNIQQAVSLPELAEVVKKLPRIISQMLDSGAGALTSGKLISRITDQLTVRFIEEAIVEMGPPPAPFAFLVLGSEGRREQTLATDQDNAIIFDDNNLDNVNAVRKYFLALGKSVCSKLDQAGFPYCKGGVMAMNKDWCLGLDEIKERVSGWIGNPNPSELLQVSIFFDFRFVHGENILVEQLQQHCHASLRNKEVFFYNLASSLISLRPNLKANLKQEDEGKQSEGWDIKLPLMMITAVVRFWSLKYGITERGTPERLLALRSVDAISDSFYEEFLAAFRFLNHLRLLNQTKNLSMFQPASNVLNLASLTEMDRLMIKRILSAIQAHQSRLATEFRIS